MIEDQKGIAIMKWWAFNEEQLDRALTAWMQRRNNPQDQAETIVLEEDYAVRVFLESPEVLANKMRGDK